MRQGTVLALLVVLASPLTIAVGIGISTGDPGGAASGGASSSSSTSSQGPSTMAAAAAASADLQVTKTDSADPVTVGDTFTYTIAVKNNGPDRATNVVATDTIPAGLTIISDGSCSSSGQTITCTRSSLNSGVTATFVITVRADTPGNKSNTASASAAETDPTPGNNADTEITTVLTAAPTGLTCTADPNGVQLDWNDVSGATGYNVYRRTGVSGSFLLLTSTSASQHLDTTAAVGQSYQYRVTSTSAAGESAPSGTCTVLSVPVFPSVVTAALALAGGMGVVLGVRRIRGGR